MVVPGRVVRIELISYFNLYPDTVATSEEMAASLDREHEQVEAQMKDLVELGILKQTDDGGRILYSYISPMCVSLVNRNGGKKYDTDAHTASAESEGTADGGEKAGGMREEGEEEEKSNAARKKTREHGRGASGISAVMNIGLAATS